jgi:hypothetical protein
VVAGVLRVRGVSIDILLTGAAPSADVPGLSAATLLSGAVGGLIVFVLTVASGAVVRTRQRGRELRGLARVIRPEMERNAESLETFQRLREQGRLNRTDYQREHPIYDAWGDTRTKLAELMPMQDFGVLANFYEALEFLMHSAEREEWDEGVEAGARIRLRMSAKQIMDAMRVVDGYCVAEWSWRLWSWCPGPTDES